MVTSPVAERYLTQAELLSTVRRYYSNHGAWPTILEIQGFTGATAAQIKKVSQGPLSAGLVDWQGSHLRLTGEMFSSPVLTYRFTQEQLAAGPPYPRFDEIQAEVQDMAGFEALPPTKQLLAEVEVIKAAGGRYIEELAAKYDVLPKTVANALFRGRKKLKMQGEVQPVTSGTVAAEPKIEPKETNMAHHESGSAADAPNIGRDLATETDRTAVLNIGLYDPHLCNRCAKRDVCPMANQYYAEEVTLSADKLPSSLSYGRMVFGTRPLIECQWFLDLARVS